MTGTTPSHNTTAVSGTSAQAGGTCTLSNAHAYSRGLVVTPALVNLASTPRMVPVPCRQTPLAEVRALLAPVAF